MSIINLFSCGFPAKIYQLEQFYSENNIRSEAMEYMHFGHEEDDDGYESRTSLDSPCCEKHDMFMNLCGYDMFGDVTSAIVTGDLQNNIHFNSDCLIGQKLALEYKDFREFSSDFLDDIVQNSDSNCLTCDRDNGMKMKFHSNESDSELFCMEPVSFQPDVGLPGLFKCMQNISLQICGGIITSRTCISDEFPSFTRVTDIGNLGALSCPVISTCDNVVSGTFLNCSQTTTCNSRRILVSSQNNGHILQRIYKSYALLDHDYCKLGGNLEIGANCSSTGIKMSHKSLDHEKLVALSKNRHHKSKKHLKTGRSQVALQKRSKSDKYVTLPGQHWKDFVYYATKRPYVGRRPK